MGCKVVLEQLSSSRIVEKSICSAAKAVVIDFFDGLRQQLKEWMRAVVIAVNVERRSDLNAGWPFDNKVLGQQFVRWFDHRLSSVDEASVEKVRDRV